MVGCVRKVNNCKHAPKLVNSRNYSKYNQNRVNQDFDQVDWSPLNDSRDVNEALKYFNTIVDNIFVKDAPPIQR